MSSDSTFGYRQFLGVPKYFDGITAENTTQASVTKHDVSSEFNSYRSACESKPISITASYADECRSFEGTNTTTRGTNTIRLQLRENKATTKIYEKESIKYNKETKATSKRNQTYETPCDYNTQSELSKVNHIQNDDGGIQFKVTKVFSSTTLEQVKYKVSKYTTKSSLPHSTGNYGVCLYPDGLVVNDSVSARIKSIWTTENINENIGADSTRPYATTIEETAIEYTIVGTSQSTETYRGFTLENSVFKTIEKVQTKPVISMGFTKVTNTVLTTQETKDNVHTSFGTYKLKDGYYGYRPHNLHYSFDFNGARYADLASNQIIYERIDLDAVKDIPMTTETYETTIKHNSEEVTGLSFLKYTSLSIAKPKTEIKQGVTTTIRTNTIGSSVSTKTKEYSTTFINSIAELESNTREQTLSNWATDNVIWKTTGRSFLTKFGYEVTNFNIVSYGSTTKVSKDVSMNIKIKYTNIPEYMEGGRISDVTRITFHSFENSTQYVATGGDGEEEIKKAGGGGTTRQKEQTNATYDEKLNLNKLYDETSRRICISEIRKPNDYIFGFQKSISQKSIKFAYFDKHIANDISLDNFVSAENMLGMHVKLAGYDLKKNSYLSINKNVSDIDYTYTDGTSTKTSSYNNLVQRLYETIYSYSTTFESYESYTLQYEQTNSKTKEVGDFSTETITETQYFTGANFSSSEDTSTNTVTIQKLANTAGIFAYKYTSHDKPELDKDYSLKIVYSNETKYPDALEDYKRFDVAKLTEIKEALITDYETTVHLGGFRNASVVDLSVNMSSYNYKYADEYTTSKVVWAEDGRNCNPITVPIALYTYEGKDFEKIYQFGGNPAGENEVADGTVDNTANLREYHFKMNKYKAQYQSGLFDDPKVSRETFSNIAVAYIEPDWVDFSMDTVFKDDGNVTNVREKPVEYKIHDQLTYNDEYTTELGQQKPLFTKFDKGVILY